MVTVISWFGRNLRDHLCVCCCDVLFLVCRALEWIKFCIQTQFRSCHCLLPRKSNDDQYPILGSMHWNGLNSGFLSINACIGVLKCLVYAFLNSIENRSLELLRVYLRWPCNEKSCCRSTEISYSMICVSHVSGSYCMVRQEFLDSSAEVIHEVFA